MTDSLSFSATYRRLVLPDLRAMIDRLGADIAWDATDWHDAYTTIEHEAYRRGSGHLDDEHQERLRNWINTRLLRVMHAHIPAVMQTWWWPPEEVGSYLSGLMGMVS